MFAQVVSMLTESLVNISGWFVLVLESAGMTVYFLAGVFLLLLTRYLLRPLFGRAGSSDTVKRSKEG